MGVFAFIASLGTYLLVFPLVLSVVLVLMRKRKAIRRGLFWGSIAVLLFLFAYAVPELFGFVSEAAGLIQLFGMLPFLLVPIGLVLLVDGYIWVRGLLFPQTAGDNFFKLTTSKRAKSKQPRNSID